MAQLPYSQDQYQTTDEIKGKKPVLDAGWYSVIITKTELSEQKDKVSKQPTGVVGLILTYRVLDGVNVGVEIEQYLGIVNPNNNNVETLNREFLNSIYANTQVPFNSDTDQLINKPIKIEVGLYEEKWTPQSGSNAGKEIEIKKNNVKMCKPSTFNPDQPVAVNPAPTPMQPQPVPATPVVQPQLTPTVAPSPSPVLQPNQGLPTHTPQATPAPNWGQPQPQTPAVPGTPFNPHQQ